jgi:hypothetical protein
MPLTTTSKEARSEAARRLEDGCRRLSIVVPDDDGSCVSSGGDAPHRQDEGEGVGLVNDVLHNTGIELDSDEAEASF